MSGQISSRRFALSSGFGFRSYGRINLLVIIFNLAHASDPETSLSKDAHTFDFDHDFSELERKVRMRACIALMRQASKAFPDLVKSSIEQMQSVAKLDLLGARNRVGFFMTINCYQKISSDQIDMTKVGDDIPHNQLSHLISNEGLLQEWPSESQTRLWKSLIDEDAREAKQTYDQQNPSLREGTSIAHEYSALFALVVILGAASWYSRGKKFGTTHGRNIATKAQEKNKHAKKKR